MFHSVPGVPRKSGTLCVRFQGVISKETLQGPVVIKIQDATVISGDGVVTAQWITKAGWAKENA